MLANMASSLIKHKRVSTTVAKAKALRSYVEPIINKSKDDTTHSRRVVFSHLQDKDTVKELFAVVAGKVAERPGGYTRIIKVGNRAGDNADMCIIELVDFNENLLKDSSKSAGKSRRSRRGGKKKSDAGQVAQTDKVEAKAEKVEAKSETSDQKEVKTDADDSEKASTKAEVKDDSASKAKADSKEETKASTETKTETEAEEKKPEAPKAVEAKEEKKVESKEESKKEDESSNDSKDENDKK